MRLILIFILLVSNLLAQSPPGHKCGFGQGGHALNRSSSPQDRDLPTLEESYVSPAGHFRIHFTRTGTHAVSGSSEVGTPDYVHQAALSADSAYTMLVHELGFLPPVSDHGIDGDELDIYIVDMKTVWGALYYGMTEFEAYTPSPAYMEVDNDFVEGGYATTGIEALQVTIAHEFFHMIQLHYSHPGFLNSSNVYWYEISSVWFEEYCYPEIDDYHDYIGANFNASQFPSLENSLYMYGHGVYGQVLDQEYGFQDGVHIMRDIWENLSDKDAMDNLENVLSSNRWSSSLTDALEKYALYNVFTGSRAIAGQYYDDAAELPEVRTMNYEIPQVFRDPFEFNLAPSRISFKRFSSQSSSNFYVRIDNVEHDSRVFLTEHRFQEGSALKSVVEDYWVPCYNLEAQDYIIFPLINGSRDLERDYTLRFEGSTLDFDDEIQAIWPNPSILNQDIINLNLMVAAPGNLKINIYNLLGQLVHEQWHFTPEGIRILELSMPDSTPAGIYFVQVITLRGITSQKFTVLK